MKRILFFSFLLSLIITPLSADIAPNPIVVKGIYTPDDCKIRMVGEVVKADIYKDSSRVECTFAMLNLGEEITIDIGFPEMIFQYMSLGGYTESDKTIFEIFVDGRKLDESDIKAPEEMESIYRDYMQSYELDRIISAKFDSIAAANNLSELSYERGTGFGQLREGSRLKAEIDSLFEWRFTMPHTRGYSAFQKDYQTYMWKGIFPWYVWRESFKKDELKMIKVVYHLPSGISKGLNYRYFKYLLSTGATWYDSIIQAHVIVQLHDIPLENVEKITPRNYSVDKSANTIEWKFSELEPTLNDDIYLQYFDPNERRAYQMRTGRVPLRELNQ